MTLSPRILYGLDETFVLFRYERGARKSRLVVRCRELLRLCRRGVSGKDPIPAGTPLVLWEISSCPFEQSDFIPVVVNGHALNTLRAENIQWFLRYHRIRPMQNRSIRFESGTKLVYATHTAYFAIELLMQLIHEGIHESNASTGIRQGR